MGGVVSGIFGGGSKAPAPPDPRATIRAQKEANQIAQITPFGNLFFGTVDPTTGEFTRRQTDALTIEETPFQEQFRLGREELSQNLLAQLLGRDDVLTPVSTDFGADIGRVEEATFEQAATRLRPEFDRQREQLEQRLADQGLPRGSEAYNESIDRLEDNQNEQLQLLSLASVQAGRAEQDRQARLASALRGQQFGEIGSLLGLAPGFQQQATPQIDVSGILQQDFANRQLAFQQQQAGDIFSPQNIASIATAVGSFSDIRLKENISKFKESNGYTLYEYNYKNDPNTRYRGVIAQEVESIKPEAIIPCEETGYLKVNYDILPVKLEVING